MKSIEIHLLKSKEYEQIIEENNQMNQSLRLKIQNLETKVLELTNQINTVNQYNNTIKSKFIYVKHEISSNRIQVFAISFK